MNRIKVAFIIWYGELFELAVLFASEPIYGWANRSRMLYSHRRS